MCKYILLLLCNVIQCNLSKVYPYLVVNDACLTESRREERVLQLLRMLNYCLGKQKETSRRLLHFTVPRVVAVSPQMRLIEDNPASTSLLDIYKQVGSALPQFQTIYLCLSYLCLL